MRRKNRIKVEKNVVSEFVGSKQSKESKKNSKRGGYPAVRVPNKSSQNRTIMGMAVTFLYVIGFAVNLIVEG